MHNSWDILYNATEWQIQYTHLFIAVINSLAPEKYEGEFREIIFKLISVIDGWGNYHESALKWMPMDVTDE